MDFVELSATSIDSSTATANFIGRSKEQNLHDFYNYRSTHRIHSSAVSALPSESWQDFINNDNRSTINVLPEAESSFPTKSTIGFINNLAILIMIVVVFFYSHFYLKLLLLKNRLAQLEVGKNNLQSLTHQNSHSAGPVCNSQFQPDKNCAHLDNVLNYGCDVLNCDAGFIIKLNHPNNLVEVKHIFSRKPTHLKCNSSIKLDNFIFREIFESSEPVKSCTLETSKKFYISDIYVRSYLGTKLFISGNFYGILCFIKNTTSETFCSRNIDSFNIMTYWIADLLESEITISKLQLDKENATKTNTAKSAFLARMSHEIRTPLAAITGYSEMLLEDIHESTEDQCIDDIHRIQKSSKHLLTIINNILDLSKIEAGKLDANLDKIDILFLVNDILNISQALAEKNCNKLRSSLPDSTLMITTDGTLLRQCILNLIANACKFTRNGEINVCVSELNIPSIENPSRNKNYRWIYIAVKDTGIGISEKNIDKLFQEFSQIDEAKTVSSGGSGLGLAISQKMCRLLGGEIIVESEPNKGSIFTIKIPDSQINN